MLHAPYECELTMAACSIMLMHDECSVIKVRGMLLSAANTSHIFNNQCRMLTEVARVSRSPCAADSQSVSQQQPECTWLRRPSEKKERKKERSM
jgi:hypothetical protein